MINTTACYFDTLTRHSSNLVSLQHLLHCPDPIAITKYVALVDVQEASDGVDVL